MGLRDVRENWDLFGVTDPLWAILTEPGKKNNLWDVEEFFRTGRADIDALMGRIAEMGISSRRRALDFGCGVGRVTQPLAGHFDEVYGVDIAPSMIEHAARYNRHGTRCKYILNRSPDLLCFADNAFDLIHSWITLQHMPGRYIRGYLREFLRVIAPGGLIVFDLPSERVHGRFMRWALGPAERIYWKTFHRGEPRMDIYGIPRPKVAGFLEGHGGAVLAADANNSAGGRWNSFVYFVTKRARPEFAERPGEKVLQPLRPPRHPQLGSSRFPTDPNTRPLLSTLHNLYCRDGCFRCPP